MTDELVSVEPDAVLTQAQTTGKMPVHWWTSDQCWRMMAKLAGQFANSTMVPSAFRNEPGNVIVALAAGMPLGLSPLACLQSVAVINGRPTLFGDAPIAQVLAHPSLVGIEERADGEISKGTRSWTIRVSRKTAYGTVSECSRTFGIEDAKRAGLWDKTGPWKSYPDRMLYNRARAYAVRDSFADVLQGIAIAADATDDVAIVAATKPAEPAIVVQQDVEGLGDKLQQEAEASKPKPRRKATKKAQEPEPDSPDGEVFTTAQGQYHVRITSYSAVKGKLSYSSHYDADADALSWSDADAVWQIVEPESGPMHAYVYDRACECLRRDCAARMMQRRMSADDAGMHIREVLHLDAPAKLGDLTLTQLADLLNDLS
jgi:hypothetical protein